MAVALCFMWLLHSGIQERAFMSKYRMVNLYYVNHLNKTFNILKLFRTFINTVSLSRYYSEPDSR